MRFLIFTLLAVAVSAANYGYGNYYGGYPSYSYSSYPSSYYGSYGSSLYGAGYGTGYGYGSGITYGGAGWTGGLGSYTTAYKPAAYQTARYSYRQPQGTGAIYESGYSPSYTPGKVEFILGDTGYQTGTSVLADHNKPVLPKPAGVFRHGRTSVHRSGAVGPAAGGTSGRISFTQDFSRVSGQSGLQRSRGTSGIFALGKPEIAVTEKRSGILADHVGSLHKTGVQTAVGDVSQVLLHEKADFTGAGFGGALPKAPARSFPGSGSIQRTEAHGNAGQIFFTQDFSEVAGHSAGKTEIHGFKQIPGPLTSPGFSRILPGVVATTGTVHKSEVHGIPADKPRISITRDFSKVSGDSEQIDIKPEIHSTDRISSPGVEEDRESAHDVSSEDKSETHGISDAGEIDSTTDVSDLGTGGVKPSAVSSGRLTASRVSALSKPSPVHRAGSAHKTGAHGISSPEGPQITFIQGTSALRQPEIKTASFDKISAPVVGQRSSYGSRVTGVQPNIRAQAFPAAAGPSRITFTQDFSRVSGTSGVKPVISTDDRLTAPVISGVVASHGYQQGARRNTVRFTSPIAARPVQRPAVEVQAFRTSKQPVADQPSFTAVYDQARTHGILPVRSDGFVAGDKSIYASGFADGRFANVEEQDGVKFSNFLVVPEAGVAHGKSSAFEHSTVDSAAGGKVSGIRHAVVGARDHSQLVVPSYGVSSAGDAVGRSNVFVAVPADDYGHDKSSVLLHSTGVAPIGSLVEEKGSIFKLSSGEVDSVLSKQGQAQGYSTVTAPFKSYYSSSYPGYSHISGESPRFDFSHDRSLLYTYSSPYLVSPFSYTYTSGNKNYVGGSRKTVA